MAKGNFETIRDAILLAIDEEARQAYFGSDQKNSRPYNCMQQDCVNLAYAKGYCNAHYIRMRSGANMERPIKNRAGSAKCTICGDPVNGRGGWNLCQKHFRARRKLAIKTACVNALGGKCRDCERSYPDYVYDFHHLDPAVKEDSVSTLFNSGSIDAIAIEVSKCTLLCANCHRVRHNG